MCDKLCNIININNQIITILTVCMQAGMYILKLRLSLYINTVVAVYVPKPELLERQISLGDSSNKVCSVYTIRVCASN